MVACAETQCLKAEAEAGGQQCEVQLSFKPRPCLQPKQNITNGKQQKGKEKERNQGGGKPVTSDF